MEGRRWRNGVLAIVGTLLALGIVMIASTSALKTAAGGDPSWFLRKQILWACIAAGGMLIAWHTDYHILGRYSLWILGGVMLLLLAVLIPGVGHEANGARRWIRFAGVGFQPSEVAKLALIIFVSSAVTIGATKTVVLGGLKKEVKGLGIALAAIAGSLCLILMEPDFGTAVLVGTLSVSVLFVAGIRLAHLIPLAAAGGVLGLYVMLTRFQHVRDRFATFLNPDLDPLGKGYQVRQSLLALGSGGLMGEGLGESRQKLFFLPLEHSDFIFAVIGEELGMIGTFLVIGLFVAFIYCGYRIMSAAPDSLGYVMAFGIVILVGLQAALNIAVVTAALPTKGMPLPFISFGGSSLLISLVAVGILLNIASQTGMPRHVPVRVYTSGRGAA
ncbi:MAG: putative lipid II flippase FtsW [Planctomycetota bacterium]|nr:putative lipid II flippase FtsW [Planctomycetota bacterium]